MSGLRRRFGYIFSASNPSSPSTESTADTPDEGSSSATLSVRKGGDQPHFDTGLKVHQIPVRRRSKRRNGLIFGLGGVFGIFLALFFANHNEVITLDALMDLNLDSLIDVMPAGIIRDASQFSVCLRASGIIYCFGYHLKTSVETRANL